MEHLLSILVFLPILGAIVTLCMRSRRPIRWAAFVTTLATLGLSLGALIAFNGNNGQVQFVETTSWISSFNIQYKLGIDGLSLPLILLTTVVGVLACVASWKVERPSRGYFALLLILQASVIGTLCAQDLLLFYAFFNLTLVPTYFLIGLRGGAHRSGAGVKFVLFALLGSIGLLIAMIGIYLRTQQVLPGGTFDLMTLSASAMHDSLRNAGMTGSAARGSFLLMMFAFLVRLPAVPFHAWLPDVHEEAPTPVCVMIATMLQSTAGYGIFRIAYPLFPDIAKEMWHWIAVVGVVGILYGALCAMAQTDFKKLAAYSSISRMGYIVLGAAMVTTASISGANFMLVANGITSAMMIVLAGIVHERAGHSEISRLGGLATTMPVCSGFGMVASFASLGMPGLCGFVGEVLVLIGTFAAASNSGSTLVAFGYATPAQILTLAIIACFGSVLTAGYMLRAIQRIFFGKERAEYQSLADANRHEILVLTPLTVMAIALGVIPGVLYFAFTNATFVEWMKLLS